MELPYGVSGLARQRGEIGSNVRDFESRSTRRGGPERRGMSTLGIASLSEAQGGNRAALQLLD